MIAKRMIVPLILLLISLLIISACSPPSAESATQEPANASVPDGSPNEQADDISTDPGISTGEPDAEPIHTNTSEDNLAVDDMAVAESDSIQNSTVDMEDPVAQNGKSDEIEEVATEEKLPVNARPQIIEFYADW